MTLCNAVFVVLGERPELDRLERCTSRDCPDHPAQLDWVRGDPGRLAAYNDQLRRYDLGQQFAAQVEQEPLL